MGQNSITNLSKAEEDAALGLTWVGKISACTAKIPDFFGNSKVWKELCE